MNTIIEEYGISAVMLVVAGVVLFWLTNLINYI